ncbi:MAG: hypothetical protein WCJ54_05580 [Actinomycetota bacterium]
MLGKLRSNKINAGIADAIVGAESITPNIPLLTNNMDHYSFAVLNMTRGLYK